MISATLITSVWITEAIGRGLSGAEIVNWRGGYGTSGSSSQGTRLPEPTPENRDYLRRLREGFGDLPVVVEFRHVALVNQPTFELLKELNLGFCSVDEPRLRGLMPPVAVATGPVAYVRFHGRNAAKWYNHEEAWERYNYTYRPEELQEWVPKLRQLDAEAPLTLVYFNNHFGG